MSDAIQGETGTFRPAKTGNVSLPANVFVIGDSGMADGLRVDTDGLRAGAASSAGLVSALGRGAVGGAEGGQPSHGGVSVILAAAQSVRGRQSERVVQQVGGMRAGASRYDDVDGHAAADVAQAI